MSKKIAVAVASCCAALVPVTALSGVTVFQDGDKYVKMGGRIQMQYHQVDPDGGSSTDELFFRRLRPYIEGSVHKDWKGKFQFDLGKAEDGNEVAVKDAYMQYSGFNNMSITVGNANFPFSRELLTSSKKQQLVERTLVGDHNFGTPDRNLGVHLKGHNSSKKINWALSAASAAIDPDVDKLDFDTPVNKNSDFNDGYMIGGRIDFHPSGQLKFSQGDFDRKTKATISVAAFSWSNDNDNNTYSTGGIATDPAGSKQDVDSVTGVEVSAAVRVSGLSADIEVNKFDTDTVDSTFNGGIYQNGSSTLDNMAIEAGYMLPGSTAELVVGYETQDADTYADDWTRTSYGVNWFIQQHDIKVQLTLRQGENIEGVIGNDEDEVFLQTQYVF